MGVTFDDNQQAFKWLAGDRLSDVLHLGDHELAYRLSDLGHEVVVASDHDRGRSARDVSYVRCAVGRLPFIGSSFDVVVAPHLRHSTSELADIARVLRASGWIATLTRQYDETIPWVRRLLELVGGQPNAELPEAHLAPSGLFGPVEITEVADWEELDLAATVTFARAVAGPRFTEDALGPIHDLFHQSAQQTGTLRLRHRTQYVRARVDKSQLAEEEAPAEVTLFDLR